VAGVIGLKLDIVGDPGRPGANGDDGGRLLNPPCGDIIIIPP
jgi:hypothetical protein